MLVAEYGRFADTYYCIKTAFHDADILADVGEDVGVVECGLYSRRPRTPTDNQKV